MRHHLGISLYAMLLASAGIPLYIHLPQFAAVELGIGLSAVAALLLAMRLFDLIQDPLLGWAIDRWPGVQMGFALGAAFGLALGFVALFVLVPAGSLWWLALVLAGLFTCYSLGTILLYGRSETLALGSGPADLLRVASFRETGLLAGVVVATVLPSVWQGLGQGYAAYGVSLAVLVLLGAGSSARIWTRPVRKAQQPSLRALRGSGALHLLGLALVNSLPVALTSTLFLFYVQDLLGLQTLAGPLLLLFFISAGVSAPLWARLSLRWGAKRVLLLSMPLAIASFVGAALLAPGQAGIFALICVVSGVALGADMVLLPALFSIALSRAGVQASLAFGIWSFAGKLALTLAAALALPLLEWRGFTPASTNTPEALDALRFAYAVLPCCLKILAFGYVWTLPNERGTS